MGLFNQNMWEPKAQAKAVRAYLEMHDGVEPSWDQNFWRYESVHIAEWHNGREEGYVIGFRNKKRECLNIAFFEHRNSDNICAIKWVQDFVNPHTIQSADFGGTIYADKYDVSHSEPVGNAMQMADWIMGQLDRHWVEGDQ